MPSILFNIAQAYRLVGNYRQSKFYYNNYLSDMPKAPNRAEVERQLSQLEAIIADEAKKGGKSAVATKAAPAAPPEPATPAIVDPKAPGSPPAPAVPVAPTEAAAESAPVVVPEAPARPEVPAAARGETASVEAEGGTGLLPLALAGGGAVLGLAGLVLYGVARGGWTDVASTERPRAQQDALIADADSNYRMAVGLGVGAALLGAGAGVTLAF